MTAATSGAGAAGDTSSGRARLQSRVVGELVSGATDRGGHGRHEPSALDLDDRSLIVHDRARIG